MENLASGSIVGNGGMRILHWTVLLNILIRLPIASIMRFKVVCKSWCSYFSQPDFIKSHLIQSQKNMGFIAEGFSNNNDETDLYFLQDDRMDKGMITQLHSRSEIRDFVLIDSCNGLLCYKDDDDNILIYNPATRKLFKLPEGPIEHPDICFGFDSKNNKYKVFRLIANNVSVPEPCRIEVFTLGSNSWRQKANVPFIPTDNWHVTARGAIHWLFHSKEAEYNNPDLFDGDHDEEYINSVLSINISEEDFQINSLPEQVGEQGPCPFLVEMRGHLSLCMIGASTMVIWTLKYNNEEEKNRPSWIKEYNFNLGSFIRPNLEVFPVPVRMNQMLLSCGGSLYFFNLESNALRQIEAGNKKFVRAYPHVETLVPPCLLDISAGEYVHSDLSSGNLTVELALPDVDDGNEKLEDAVDCELRLGVGPMIRNDFFTYLDIVYEDEDPMDEDDNVDEAENVDVNGVEYLADEDVDGGNEKLEGAVDCELRLGIGPVIRNDFLTYLDVVYEDEDPMEEDEDEDDQDQNLDVDGVEYLEDEGIDLELRL